MSTLILDYLANNSIASLESLGIFSHWSNENPKKVSLNYDQIESKDGDPLVDACRGLILKQISGLHGEAGTYKVIARPFYRFYNLGSGHAADLDWNNVVFEEKLDGTLCIVYWDEDLNKWCVATRNVPDADIKNSNGQTFAELFWQHIKDFDYNSPKNYTYCYELTGPENQIVVRYDDWKIILLSVFDSDTSEEVLGLGCAPIHSFKNRDEAVSWLNSQPGHTLEGFVARQGTKRVKVKSSQYFAVAKVMTASGSDLGLIDIILSGTADDVRTILPALRQEKIDKFAEKIADLAHRIEKVAIDFRTISDRKTVAISISQSDLAKWIGPILDIWSGRYQSFSDWLNSTKKNGGVSRTILERILNTIGD